MSQKEVTFPYRSYLLDGILLVPHYAKEMWVAPGYPKTKEYSEEELNKRKAKTTTQMLWHRPKHKILE